MMDKVGDSRHIRDRYIKHERYKTLRKSKELGDDIVYNLINTLRAATCPR
jgi:hypothetical protein